jgi:hypothetical protein
MDYGMETWRLESRALLESGPVRLHYICCPADLPVPAVPLCGCIFISSAYICLLCCLLLPVARAVVNL